MWLVKNYQTAIAFACLVFFIIAAVCAVNSIRTTNTVAEGIRQFEPIKTSLIGASTQRQPVDIEIVGSARRGIAASIPKSDYVIRLRLERAFITNFLLDKPRGSSLLSLVVDQPTGLPGVLVGEVSRRGRHSPAERDVPIVTHEELRGRQIRLNFDSDQSDTAFSSFFAEATKCTTISDGPLQEIEQEKSVGTGPCARSTYPDGRKWLARGADGEPVIIECHGFSAPLPTPCTTRFTFQKFSVRLGFEESKLHRWFEVLEFGRKFLASKQIP